MSVATAIAAQSLTQRRIVALDQWAAIGLMLAEKVVSETRRSLAGGARAFLRICQAVRLAIVLASRLDDPDSPAFQPTPAKARAGRPAEPKALAEQAAPEKPAASRAGGIRFALDRYADDEAILRRPLAEIVKVICRALGVTPDWSLWSDQDEASAGPESEVAAAQAAPCVPPPEIPRPRPRPGLILDRPQPPPLGGLRARLRSSCAPGALCPVVAPIAVPAIGRLRLAED